MFDVQLGEQLASFLRKYSKTSRQKELKNVGSK